MKAVPLFFERSFHPYAAAWAWGSSDRSLPADMGKIIAEYIGSAMPAR